MKRILIVDNSMAVKKLIRHELEAEGYEVHEAGSGEEALELMPSLRPDLVTLNVEMKGIDGYETCARIRGNPDEAVRKSSVIFVTAQDSMRERTRGFNAGAADFIAKPFNRGDLALAIGRILFPRISYPGSRALIVESAPAVRGILNDCMASLVEQTVTATSGEEALEILKAEGNAISVMITDWMLPGIGGAELCTRARRGLGLERLPVIFVTGSTDRDIFLALFKAGGADVVIVPFAKEELIARVRVHLESAWLYRELEKRADDLVRLNETLTETKNALWSEMKLAERIQTTLLPDRPRVRGHEVLAYMRCADEVGGDYYDIINCADRDWIIVGDVSGHGVTAGLVMMMVQTSIHLMLNEFPDAGPSALLQRVNRTIYDNILKIGGNKYMTIQALAVSENGTITHAGLHQEIIVRRAADGSIEKFDPKGMWIGIQEDISGEMADGEFALASGDLLFLFTDGVTEAWDDNEDMFGDANLVKLIAGCGSAPLEQIRDTLLAALGNYNCDDDVTFVIARKV